MRYFLAAILLVVSAVATRGESVPPCLNELEVNFFKKELLGQVFNMYAIPQGVWDPIYSDLVDRSQTIPYRLEKKALKFTPNPLNYPYNGEEIEPLLREALFEVFNEVLMENDISNEAEIKEMFNMIYSRDEATVGQAGSVDYASFWTSPLCVPAPLR